MKMENGRFIVYGNALKRSHSQETIKWHNWLAKKFSYDPNEKYTLSLQDNPYLGQIFGLKDIVRGDQGHPLVKENTVVVSTIRMGSATIELPWRASLAPELWALRRIGSTC